MCEHRTGCFHTSASWAFGSTGKEQTLPDAEDLFSRYGVGFGQSDSTPHAGTCSVGVDCLNTFKSSSRLPGAYGSYGGSHAVGAASYETASTLASWPNPEVGVQRGTHRVQVTTGLPPNPSPRVRHFVPSGRVPLEQVSRHAVVYTDASTTGGVPRSTGLQCRGGLDGPPTALAHQLPRVAGSTPGLGPPQEPPTRRARTGPHGQHCDRCVHQPTRWSTLPSQLARHLLLWSQKHLRSLRAIHIPGLLNRAADELSQAALPGEWRLHPQTVQLMWRRFGPAQVDLFASLETSHCQCFSR